MWWTKQFWERSVPKYLGFPCNIIIPIHSIRSRLRGIDTETNNDGISTQTYSQPIRNKQTRAAKYVYWNRNRLSPNHCYCGKTRISAHSEYVFVALFIQHAMCMRLISLSSVVCPAQPHFSPLSHKRYDFGEKLLNTKCVF